MKRKSAQRVPVRVGGLGSHGDDTVGGIWAGATLDPTPAETLERRVRDRDQSGPQMNGAAMSDKSPRQTMTKKAGKSLKEKRAEKRAKAEQQSSTDSLLHPKKR